MIGSRDLREQLISVSNSAGAAIRRNWRMLVATALVAVAVGTAVEVSDRQGRFDLSYGYSVRMTCEADPEAHLWSGGCDRIDADLARTDKPSLIELYQDFITVHHRQIPSPETTRRFVHLPCEQGFDRDAALKGTRYVLETVRVFFDGVCRSDHAEAIMSEVDVRDRARLSIEREGLSHAALYAGAAANLSEPLIIFVAVVAGAGLWLL